MAMCNSSFLTTQMEGFTILASCFIYFGSGACFYPEYTLDSLHKTLRMLGFYRDKVSLDCFFFD